MGKASRKPRPAAPNYRYWDTDGCWFCKNRNGCGSCKVNKQYVAKQKQKRDREFKRQMRNYDEDYEKF